MLKLKVNKLIINVAILNFLCLISVGQGKIEGRVLDSVTNRPLNGVFIKVASLNLKTKSDSLGYFQLAVGQHNTLIIDFFYPGYKRLEKRLIIPDEDIVDLSFSLVPLSFEIPQVVVTARRLPVTKEKITRRVDLITGAGIGDQPHSNTDDLLNMITGVQVNRSWGIFSKNSAVTMRGLNGNARTLVLIDGVPINKSAGGPVNWHMIRPELIERIEVVKGPGSSLYGNNAMAGTINVITKTPEEKFGGMFKATYGSFGTWGGLINVNQSKMVNGKRFYWGIYTSRLSGDGYINAPDDIRDSTSAKTFLEEFTTGIKAGYEFAKGQRIDLHYQFYDDLRNEGIQVYEKDGLYNQYETNLAHLNYSGTFNRFKVKTKLFWHLENYYRQNEKVNRTGKYRLRDNFADKGDMGIWSTIGYYGKQHQVISGIDLKLSRYDAEDIYRTSPDELYYGGYLNFYGFFLNDQLYFSDNRLIFTGGLRVDHARFYDGFFEAINPTSQTGFIRDVYEETRTANWTQFSPNLSAKYRFTEKYAAYVSYSSGFMPPKLDDLVRSGKINRGFKLANPALKPETINSWEVGSTMRPTSKLEIEPSFYFSIGKDFHYFVSTGDSVDAGAGQLKPVYQRQNISKVRVIGAELAMKYHFSRQLYIRSGITYNDSEIIEFPVESFDSDLTGNFLMEVSPVIAYGGVYWDNRWLNAAVYWHYTGYQWYDDENSRKIDPYNIIDIKLSKEVTENFLISLTMQNVLDHQYIDRKGLLAPGRFILGDLVYRF